MSHSEGLHNPFSSNKIIGKDPLTPLRNYGGGSGFPPSKNFHATTHPRLGITDPYVDGDTAVGTRAPWRLPEANEQ